MLAQNDVAAEAERRTIRDAMERLLLGEPIRSDGKLTVKCLAEEAAVKRWVLTHKHPDLQDEFRARIAAQGQLPPAQQVLVDENTELRNRISDLNRKLATAREEARQLARVVQVLTLENEQLKTAPTGNVRPIRPGR